MQVTYNKVLTKDPVAEAVTKEITAPVLCDFVSWILKSAEEAGIKRLYFLARDGWIMHKAAQRIAEKAGIDIQLRYLCCSRMSLRNAALSDLGEEAYRYLLEGGFALTPAVILGRLRLNSAQRSAVYADIGFSDDENIELGKAAASDFCGKLRKSAVYNALIREVSVNSRENALAYLKQEGLFDDVPYALADSGWTGSVQRMLRVLTGKLQTGFYFGIYGRPDPQDGIFNAYLFDKSTPVSLVSRFNNHLFEAICGAPHGMTVGYEAINGEIVPVFNNEYSLNSGSSLLQTQEQAVYDYIESSFTIPQKIKTMAERQKFAFPLLDKLMYTPDREVAEKYGSLRFSDDPAELYSFPLAAPIDDAKRLYLLPRLREKYFRKDKLTRPVYWGYATAVLSGKGGFCRFNLRLWEILWLLRR